MNNEKLYSMNYVSIVDIFEEGSLFAFNSSGNENMMVGSPSVIMENENVVSITANATGNTAIHEGEQKSNSNTKYHYFFKPSASPISHRLRSKK